MFRGPTNAVFILPVGYGPMVKAVDKYDANDWSVWRVNGWESDKIGFLELSTHTHSWS